MKSTLEKATVMQSKTPLSYSRLSTFEQCPQKFDYLYITKNIQDMGNEHTIYGNRVHESLEKYGKTGDVDELTAETREWKGLVDGILSKEGDKHFEYQMAIDQDEKTCDWFDSNVWLRSIADVLVIDGDKAYCFDWKTGKVRDNPTQLQLFSCMIMLHFPQVNEVKTAFVWLKYGQITDVTYQRKHLSLLWNGLTTRFAAVQDAVEIGSFKSKPSGLCRWCPAKEICADAK